jgi:KaiC/GvpD/RAD55 family RecA-like ATPase
MQSCKPTSGRSDWISRVWSGAREIVIDHVHVERSEITETGEYDLEGLFVRLNHAIDSIGAKRVVLDTLEALFAGIPNEAILRAELRRLFSWLEGQRRDRLHHRPSAGANN